MKNTKLIILIVLILAIAVAAVLAGPWLINNQKLGLDLQGGIHIVYQATDENGGEADSDAVTKAIAILDKRVNEFGVSEPIIQQEGDDRIIVELAGVDNPEEAIDILGRTALLEFKTSDGTTVLTGSYLKDAQASYDASGKPCVDIEFNSEGAKIFGEVTTNHVKEVLAIYLDGELLTAPVIEEPITGGTASISGSYQSLEEANEDAVLLRSGALPVTLEIMEMRTVGATLGSDSLAKSMKAAMIGLALVFIFIVLYYKLPGIVAVIALIVYILLDLAILAAINATLTLPGIAGVLLSVGMAVDLNILVFERLKEELQAGKSLRMAIHVGFKRALTTVIDSNATTIIVACVLFYFTSGTIKGFALTLIIGLLVSLFTAVTFTRLVMNLMVESKLVKTTKFFRM